MINRRNSFSLSSRLAYLLIILSLPSFPASALGDSAKEFSVKWRQYEEASLLQTIQNLKARAVAGDASAALQAASLILSLEQWRPYHLTELEQLLLPFAQSRKPEAQFILAKLYLKEGEGYADKANNLLLDLAYHDWVPAMLLLANIDASKEREMLSRAAQLGDVEAQYRWGRIKFLSDKDNNGLDLIRRSAGRRFIPAQLFLAELSMVSERLNEVFFWYSKATAAGSLAARDSLAILYMSKKDEGLHISNVIKLLRISGMTELDAIIHAQNLHRLYKNNDHKGLALLGLSHPFIEHTISYPLNHVSGQALYQKGFAIKRAAKKDKDYHLAREYYYRAAVRGYVPAMNSLGVLHEKGFGVPKNLALAEMFYLHCAEQNFIKSMLNLVEVYMSKDKLAEAKNWLSKVHQNSARKQRIIKRLNTIES